MSKRPTVPAVGKVRTPVVPAVLQNNAGIVGAAMATTGRY